QLAAVFENVLKMQLRAVILTHRSGKAATRYRGRATGGAPFGHLDDIDAGLGALECGHGSGGAATDDQDVGLVSFDWNVEPHWLALLPALCCIKGLAITKNASTHASANALSLMCSGTSSISVDVKSRLRESTIILQSPGIFHGPLSLPSRSRARRLVCSLKPSTGMRTRTGPLAALSRLANSAPSCLNSSALVRISRFCALYWKNSRVLYRSGTWPTQKLE